ncbi:MAG: Lrp/AsnC family transcriptional regulator [Pseudomonadota bacterium]
MNGKLDKIDISILNDLQNTGRITNVELAKRAGISAPPCLRRVNALEDQGIISSYHAHLNPQMLGFTVTIFSEVALTSQNDADLRIFEEKIQEWPLVRECYMVTGGADFLLKIIAQDFDAYQNFLSTQLSTFPLVSQIKTRMVIRASKKQPGIPLELLSI